MARSRTLKPSFFTSEQLADLQPLHRLLFAGLWCLADRKGKLRDRPRKIRAELFPYEAGYDLDAALQDLSTAGLILRYGSGEDRFIKILGFEKHQRPHPKEPASEIPEPGKVTAAPDLSAAGPDLSAASREKVLPDPSGSSVSPFQDPPTPSLPATVAAAVPGWLAGLVERLGNQLGRTLTLGKDAPAVVEAFSRYRAILVAEGYEDPDTTLLADCVSMARKSKAGPPGSLAFFVGWLNQELPARRRAP